MSGPIHDPQPIDVSQKALPLEDSITGKFITAVCNMDHDLIKVLLRSSRFTSGERSDLLKKFKYIFRYFAKEGDSSLQPVSGECRSKTCSFKCRGYSFIGEKSRQHLDLIIQEENGEFIEIYDCLKFVTDQKLKVKQAIPLNLKEINAPGYVPF